MTENQREEIKHALINKGITNAEYTNGSFHLCNIYGKRRELYIKENNPEIGFYGCDYETMRKWADSRVQPLVTEKFTEWEFFRRNTEKPDGPRAVWFNLRRKGWKGEWFDNKDAVIDVAVELYEWLEDCGIMADTFDATHFELEGVSQYAETFSNDEPGLENGIGALLKSNLQVILTGAPGTGKTYTAREVAKVMVGAMVSKDAPEDEKEKAKKTEEERIASIQFHPGYDYSDFVIGMKPKLVGEKQEQVAFYWEDGVFKKFADDAKKALDDAKGKSKEPPKFVFLIDEINRADLSRVFGELFSLLEEEYRYPKNKNGIKLPNGKSFIIPENLYIIGTMNDIDRSVESMDFALRRRFAWYEVTAESSKHIIRKKVADENAAQKLESAMDDLNGLIAPPLNKKDGSGTKSQGTKPSLDLRLGSEYQLGGAIFAKFEKYQNDSDDQNDSDAYTKLWDNHIENILSEYLRGRSNRKELVEGLRQVFYDAIKGKPKQTETQAQGSTSSVANGGSSAPSENT